LKCALLKIAHDKYRAQKRQSGPLTDINEAFHSAKQSNPDVASLVNSYTEVLNPVRVLELFERIPTEVSTTIAETDSFFNCSHFSFLFDSRIYRYY